MDFARRVLSRDGRRRRRLRRGRWGMIYLLIALAFLGAVFFAWSLCRIAALSDERNQIMID